jgi:hypothetical protein
VATIESFSSISRRIASEGERAPRHARLEDRVGELQRVARRAHERGGPVVAHDGHLARRVLARDRDDRGADPLGAGVQAEGAGEEAVVEGDLHDVVLGDAAGHQVPGDEVGPGPEVVAGVADRGGAPGRAGGGVHANHVAQRHREEAVGVRGPEVVLGGEGEPAQVGQRAEAVRVEADLVEPLPVEGDVQGDTGEGRLETLELDLLQLLAVDALALGLPDGALRVQGHALFSASTSVPR